MANKITKAQMLEMIKAQVSSNAEMVAFIDHELELLAKKSEGKKATKTQRENIGLKAIIKEVLMSAPTAMTVTEIQKADEDLSALSNQKVSALVRQLVECGEVNKIVEKKVSKFTLV